MILVTGGAGFIGSHTCVALAAAHIPYVILDNFSNSRRSVMERLRAITGTAPLWVDGDVRDAELLQRVLADYPIDAVMHFAAFKVVAESARDPLAYYENNVSGTVTLLRAMRAAGVRTLVFSSSATVYGDPAALPVREDFPLRATSPYGWSKHMVEQVLTDLDAAEPHLWRIALLRYFNPVGAHESGLIGEDPQTVPSNLLPLLAQVAVGQRDVLSVYGNDYPTPDGTGMRDYIHVSDVAQGHVAAWQALRRQTGVLTVNLGTGQPVSVLEMVRGFEKASGCTVPYKMAPRRAGDVAQCWADPSRAEHLLNWKAQLGLDRMCADAWRWQNGMAREVAGPASAAL